MRRTLPLLALAAALMLPAGASASPFEPIGDQLRISRMGADSDPDAFAAGKDIGYDERDDRYLVVWDGRDAAPDKRSLFGQVLDGTGEPISGRVTLADQGPDGVTPFEVLSPAVTWNPDANEFLVVWTGRPAAGDGRDVFARRVGPDGSVLDAQPRRVSDTGPAGADPTRDANEPHAAYNPAEHQYLVTWTSDDPGDVHFEVFGQILTSTLNQTGVDDFRISRTGPNDTGQSLNVAARPAYDKKDNRYLVTWRGIAGASSAIRGQQLTKEGAEVGPDDYRISNAASSDLFSIFDDDLVYNPDEDAFLVVYDGKRTGGEAEVRAQRMDGDGVPVGDEIRVSDMGFEGSTAFEAEDPELVYNPQRREYLVVWDGDDTADDDFEVFAQRLAPDGSEIGPNDLRLSFTGEEGEQDPFASDAHVAFRSRAGEYLTIWDANPGTAGLDKDHFEVFGQRLGDGSPAPPAPPVPPAGPPGGTPPAQQPPLVTDTTAPVLRLLRSRAQRILRLGGVKVMATADEDSLFSARGTIALPGGAARSIRLSGARTRTRARKATLRLKLPRKQRAVLSRALRRSRRLKAIVTVTATNEAGLTRTRRVAVKLVR